MRRSAPRRLALRWAAPRRSACDLDTHQRGGGRSRLGALVGCPEFGPQITFCASPAWTRCGPRSLISTPSSSRPAQGPRQCRSVQCGKRRRSLMSVKLKLTAQRNGFVVRSRTVELGHADQATRCYGCSIRRSSSKNGKRRLSQYEPPSHRYFGHHMRVAANCGVGLIGSRLGTVLRQRSQDVLAAVG